MNRVFCKNCKYRTTMHFSNQCKHENAAIVLNDPVYGRYVYDRNLCNLQNQFLDCSDFEEKESLWQKIKKVICGGFASSYERDGVVHTRCLECFARSKDIVVEEEVLTFHNHLPIAVSGAYYRT